MRNGNTENKQRFAKQINLFILPMRNGNDIFLRFSNTIFILFILPMRNGNMSVRMEEDFRRKTFYPTYEEWKLEYFLY